MAFPSNKTYVLTVQSMTTVHLSASLVDSYAGLKTLILKPGMLSRENKSTNTAPGNFKHQQGT